MRKNLLRYISVFLVMVFASCKEFVQIDPPRNELSTPTVFATDAAAESAIRGIYTAMGDFTGGFGSTFSALQGISSDELVNIGSQFVDHYENSLRPSDASVYHNWTSLYHTIYLANAAIEGVERSEGISPDLAQRLIGEAKFIRGFCYFYLLQLWGDIPLVLSTDYRLNAIVLRTAVSQVYAQIIDDFIDAKYRLPDDYSLNGNFRTRANRWTCSAMLARTYLFREEWEKAELEATLLIENASLFSLEEDLNDVFLVTSLEVIFQQYPTGYGNNNSLEAKYFLPTEFLLSLGVPPLYPITEYLLMDFELNDERENAWINSVELDGTAYHYPFKYKIHSGEEQVEFTVLLRLAEQYLIRAEARAHLGNVNGPNSAESDLNIIRNRAGLQDVEINNVADMLDAIMQERRIELFSEWGHRWFDLVRTGKANSVLGGVKADWSEEDVIRPIPQQELDLNPALSQNPGY